MLCEVCRRIFEGGPQGGKYKLDSNGRSSRCIHHATTAALLSSAFNHCYICKTVWKDAASNGFARGPGSSWERDCSTSYVVQTVDRLIHSLGCLELIVSFSRQRQPMVDGPGDPRTVFYTKFVVEYDSSANESSRMKENIIYGPKSTEAAVEGIGAQWLKSCLETHTRCNRIKFSVNELPTRLIDVMNNDVGLVYLRESNALTDNFPYVTLSHCWGNAEFFKLTSNNHEHAKSGIRISELPTTFRHAIAVARKLGFRYLWVDSLCILQDSEGDWITESAKMGATYSRAVCNIAGSASKNTNGGLFRDRDVRYIEPIVVDVTWQGLPKGKYHVYYQKFWERDFARGPLLQRGWVLQERMLARSVLHFNNEQLFWECEELIANETYPVGIPSSVMLFDSTVGSKSTSLMLDGERLRELNNMDCSDKRLNPIYVWDKIVKTYTACKLTRAEDKLVAMCGIAEWMYKVLASDPLLPIDSGEESGYLAGLWRENLIPQLLWVVKDGKRPKAYRAPSWSWASVDGIADFTPAMGDGTNLIDIVEATIGLVSKDPFGQVTAGALKLCGHLIPIKISAVNSSNAADSLIMSVSSSISALCRPDSKVDRLKKSLYCLPIRIYRRTTGTVLVHEMGCLILERADPHVRGQYRRWGQVVLDNGSDARILEAFRIGGRFSVSDYEEYNVRTRQYTINII